MTLPRPQRKPGLAEKAKSQPGYLKSALRGIHRARTRLLVCLLTLPVYMAGVWFLLENDQGIEAFMYAYMAVWGVFAVDMAVRKCPRCGEQFYVKTVLLNLITKRCVHCGLSEDDLPADETEN